MKNKDNPFADFVCPIYLKQDFSWTGEFESLNQRTDEAYFYVSLWQKDVLKKQFFVRVHCHGSNSDLRALIQDQLHQQIAIGESNTDYTGSMIWNMNRKKN